MRIEFNNLEPKNDEIEVFSAADFEFNKAQPGMDRIVEVAGKYGDVKNLILLARGGSISAFRAFWEALGKYISDKNVFFVDTTDPDWTLYVKDKCSPKDSLVLAISKSGTTVDVLENVFSFRDFKQAVITTENDNPLHKIAKEKGYDILPHQNVGGRFSGLTEVGLLPAVLVGLDISEIRKGGVQAYADFEKGMNDAKKLALIVKDLSDEGYSEIFWPIYSKKLAGFSELIAQLINETVSKEGKGVSTIIAEGPESHHYLNQRFFGGPKNMVGFFTSLEIHDEEEKIAVPQNLKNVSLRDGKLGILDGLKLSKSMEFELEGAYKDALNNKIPSVKIEIEKADEFNLGYFTAFIQVFAIYLARAFEVNPFDQPEVEGAKAISFELRKNQ